MKKLVFLLLAVWSCQSSPKQVNELDSNTSIQTETLAVQTEPLPLETMIDTTPVYDYDTIEWTDLALLDESIIMDLRYATTNNFVDTQMYECGRCFLRPEVAEAIVDIHQQLQATGYGLKMYDCYRPRPVQWALWRKVPDPRYVADPRKGSMHNRGSAVDLTIVDARGEELDMGTDFDFFGKRAYHAYRELPDTILQNRKLLKTTMEENGFSAIRTEWWHYSFKAKSYALSDMVWNCQMEEGK